MNWRQRLSAFLFNTPYTGTLEKIDLTFGGAGNQVMTIDGYEYATWLDYKKWPKIGEKVRFRIHYEHDGRGNKLRAATILREVNTNSAEDLQ